MNIKQIIITVMLLSLLFFFYKRDIYLYSFSDSPMKDIQLAEDIKGTSGNTRILLK